MINNELLNPDSITIVGGSDDILKPGGKVLRNILDGNYRGKLMVVNPKADSVQGVESFRSPDMIQGTDLAILAIAAKYCKDAVEVLARKKGCKAFIILSAGFGEESEEGAKIEKEIVDIINSVNGCLIGPNCIGFLNQSYNGVFTKPTPELDSQGVDFISGSGATAVFIMESAIPNGIRFSSVYSVGNSAQTGVEDVLKYMDENYEHGSSSAVKLLYLESISKPAILLKHASSLISKGCKIAAVKSGSSDAGSRAASSHTGAMSTPDVAVDALFRKAGIIRCYSRQELAAVASILSYPIPEGRNMAIVTHAGGPAVMMTDALANGNINVPHLEGPKTELLLEKLFPGSSVANPIDFLATGNAEQMDNILDACENDFDEIDAVAIIFGSSGLFCVDEVYSVIDERMKTGSKPIYPVFPSLITAGREVKEFIAKGRINFPDEVVFADAFTRVINTSAPELTDVYTCDIDISTIREVIDNSSEGYLEPQDVQKILDAAGIARVKEVVVETVERAAQKADEIGYPLVMKVVGPVHKSDVGGVVVNISSVEEVISEFNRMMKIKDTTAVLLQPMISGIELFAGAKHEEGFGHLVMAGLGGIFIEVLKDVQSAMIPVSSNEAFRMIESLKAYKLLQGVRGQEGVNVNSFASVLTALSALLEAAPEIFEMDLNPLMGNPENVIAVDARIRIIK